MLHETSTLSLPQGVSLTEEEFAPTLST